MVLQLTLPSFFCTVRLQSYLHCGLITNGTTIGFGSHSGDPAPEVNYLFYAGTDVTLRVTTCNDSP